MQIQKAETWKEKEISVHWSTSPTLTKALAVDFSFSRHETAKECFDHLTLAQPNEWCERWKRFLVIHIFTKA
jgi:hypothetical protein